jgi:hypothetical protein
MAINRYYSAIAQDATLSSTIVSGSTSMTVSGVTGWPTSYPFVLAIDYGTSSEELVLVSNVAGTTVTMSRGFNGSTAVGHNAGATIRHVVVAQDLTELQAHINNQSVTTAGVYSTGVHGVSGSIVGTTDTQSLSNKTLSSSKFTYTLNNQTTDYTVVDGDQDKIVTLTSATDKTITLPTGVLGPGAVVNVMQLATGAYSVTGVTGVTVSGRNGLKTAGVGAFASIVCTSSNTYAVIGDVTT